MLCGSFSFACMGVLASDLGSSCDWRVIALARSGLALVFGALLARAAGARLVFRRPRILWVRSFAGSVSLVCTFYALSRLPPHVVLTLTNTFPLWVAVLSWPLLGERPAGSVWLAAGCGVLGIVLIQRPFQHEPVSVENVAVLLALVSSFSTAVAMLGLHHLQEVDTSAIVVHFSSVAVLFCAAAFFVGGPVSHLGGVFQVRTLLGLLGVGLTATVGQLFLTRAFAAGPPAKVSIIGLTQIVFALALDVWLLQQPFHPSTLLGVALVIAPTAWVMALRA
jgi:drug/metabolite transporter (DMT)-like permease